MRGDNPSTNSFIENLTCGTGYNGPVMVYRLRKDGSKGKLLRIEADSVPQSRMALRVKSTK